MEDPIGRSMRISYVSHTQGVKAIARRGRKRSISSSSRGSLGMIAPAPADNRQLIQGGVFGAFVIAVGMLELAANN